MYDVNNAAVVPVLKTFSAAGLSHIRNLRQDMENSENELIAQCQKGELERFGRLYDQYIEKIYRFIFYLTRHRETAEDLTAQTFERALEGIGTFNAGKGRFSSWLYRIARNSVIDHFRVNRPAEDLENQPEPVSVVYPERETGAVMNLELVQKYLAQFSPQQRDIVIMRVWDGLAHREIAEILGISEANSKVIFSRVLLKLKQEMPVLLAALLAFVIN